MVEQVDALIHLDWYAFVMGVCIVITAFIGLNVAWEKVRKIIGFKTKRDLYQENHEQMMAKINERLDKLEEVRIEDVARSEQNDLEIKNGMKDLKDILEIHIEKDRKKTVATLRSTLYRIHKESMDQNFITREALKVFTECGGVYEENGGDDIYHDKLYPEVIALELRE